MRKPTPSPLVIAAGAALLVSLIWVVLAWRTPTSTFHFAPLIAGAIGPYAAKFSAGPLSVRPGLRVTAVALAVVASAIGVLAAADRLRGPTFWSSDGAVLEAALFATIGAIVGLGYLSARRAAAKVNQLDV